MGVNSTQLQSPRRTTTVLARGVAVGIAAAAVVGVSTPAAPIVSQAAVRLVDTTIGIGGSFDPLGLSIPMFFYGTAVPQGDSFHVVPYPGQINVEWPIISALPGLSGVPYWPHSLKQSERIGAGYLEQDIAKQASGEKITILGMSQGAQVAEIARADMAKDPTYVAHAGDYSFTLIGDPYQPNGGILSRFTSWSRVPILGDLFPLGRPGPSDSPFQTTVYQNQYDGFADFPAYFNPLAIVNALLGIMFEHVLPGYALEPKTSSNTVSTTVGNTTYVTFPQRLPLLAPLRLAASLIGAQRLVDAMDPVLRVIIESAYDRTADPSQVKQFSWITPQAKISAALKELPGALAQSMQILRTGKYTPTLPQPTVDATEPVTPTTDHPAKQVDNSPLAKAIRQSVVNLTAALTNITRPVAKLLQVVGGQKPTSAQAPSAAAAVAASSTTTPQALPSGGTRLPVTVTTAPQTKATTLQTKPTAAVSERATTPAAPPSSSAGQAKPAKSGKLRRSRADSVESDRAPRDQREQSAGPGRAVSDADTSAPSIKAPAPTAKAGDRKSESTRSTTKYDAPAGAKADHAQSAKSARPAA
ncbi:PE-PPE domain-containing protein [Mycolicibacterium sp. NCC-Tsukiji]|uniref:PE-PPE domain-containing protein n=1 Tax=Mycolicibacterium sp. NCC-Tsukiji TaxID=2185272 RepID=UPI000EBC4B76|nr:PE-PPE domain-containing protein [Mycolicibacterium sp. NCC-Tsukiji]GCB00268.1 PE/PPE family protein [Mycolicibacterium sp. NCC-Tsukiji]